MIRLNSIPQGLAVEYKKYRLKKLTNCLKQLIEKREKVAGTGVTNEEKRYCREVDRIAGYLSVDGNLDDTKIEELLLGNITKLKDAVNQIGIVKSPDIKDTFDGLYNNLITNKIMKDWAKKTGVTVCPYCNRSYIFTVENGGIRPQYDHFFPRADYPYLSISMYNLIPCCSVCNLAKHDKSVYVNGKLTMIYPYENGYGHQAVFDVTSKDKPTDRVSAWLGMTEDYAVQLRYTRDIDDDLKAQIENSWKEFKLQELYEQHSDYIRDILRTNYIYNDAYFESLVEQFPTLFVDAAEAKNLVYFNYLDEKDWGKRILAKLTHDLEADNP